MPITTRLMKKKNESNALARLRFLVDLHLQQSTPSDRNITCIRLMTTILLCPVVENMMITTSAFRNVVLVKCEQIINERHCYPELRLLCNEIIRRYE